MIVPVHATCASCRFFRRFSPQTDPGLQPALVDDSEEALSMPILSTEPHPDILDYGKCVRNPPQFFSQSLSGEWPIIHDSRYCGEYRPDAARN